MIELDDRAKISALLDRTAELRDVLLSLIESEVASISIVMTPTDRGPDRVLTIDPANFVSNVVPLVKLKLMELIGMLDLLGVQVDLPAEIANV